jgi:hypothetical protein
MVDIGTKADGTRILPQTETQGTAVDASSIYLVKFGADEAERAVTVIYNGPPTVFDVRDLGELQAKPSERVRIEGSSASRCSAARPRPAYRESAPPSLELDDPTR